MRKARVNNKDKRHDTNIEKLQESWNEALRDAEMRLREAQKDVFQWKDVINVCRERIATRIPWPGSNKVKVDGSATQI